MNTFNTMIIDDTKYTFCKNYGNAIEIPKYNPNIKENKILSRIAHKLTELKTKNFRKWQNRFIYWNEENSLKKGLVVF